MNIIDILETIVIYSQLSTVTPVDALRLPSRTASVEDKPGVSTFNRDYLMAMPLGDLFHLFIVILVITFVDILLTVAAPLDYDTWQLGYSRKFKSFIDVSNIRNDSVRFIAS